MSDDLSAVKVVAKKGDKIHVQAVAFIEPDIAVQLVTTEDFMKVKKQVAGFGMVLIAATAMTTLTPESPSWTVIAPADDEWRILFQPLRGKITAALG